MFNSIFLIFGLVILLIFFISIAVIHIRSLRDDINIRWYNLVDKLQYRQDMVPNLIETIRKFLPEDKLGSYKDLINKTIEIRAAAGKNSNPGSEKIISEHDLSTHIKELISLGQQYEELKRSTNYLELKKEFKDISKKINDLSLEYNKKVRHHNDIIKRPYNVLPAILMKYKKKKIFEFE